MYSLQCFVFVGFIQCTIITGLMALEDKILQSELVFDCKHSSVGPLEFHTRKGRKIENIKIIGLTRCEGEKFGNIIEEVIADNIRELTLQLTHNLTWTLSRKQLAEFRNLTVLKLPRNKLKNVTADLLHDLKNLEILDLQENDLRELPTGFLNLDNLRHLTLKGNKLKVIEPKMFEKLEKLKYLNVQNNKLVEIKPHSFRNLKSLVWLHMDINNLQTLPEDIFANLKYLNVINLSQNNFRNNSLPKRLFENKKFLKTVSLFGNRQNLMTLPSKFFANLTQMTRVDIGRSNIVHLPEDLFEKCINIHNLLMMSNGIQELPRHIFKDSKEFLLIKLNSNKLRELPDGVFSMLHKLEDLDLSNNYITTLNESIFRDLTSLKVLNMETNRLKTIHDNVFQTLQNLRIARFSFNQLTLKSNHNEMLWFHPPLSPFHFCGCIEELHLSSNNISEIFSDWRMAAHLRTLDLKHNNVQSLNIKDMLFSSENLNVDLSFNQIRRISLAEDEVRIEEVSQEHRKDIIISLGNNPINCNCSVDHLIRFHENRMPRYVYNNLNLNMSNLICHKPSPLMNKPVKNLTSEKFRCRVENLEIYNITCPQKCECFLQRGTQEYIVDCSYKGLKEAPKYLESPRGLSIHLNMTGNSLTKMPSMKQNGYDLVTILSLSDNKITEVPLDALSQNLSVLHLHSNNLTRLEASVLEFLISTKLKELTLQMNPWDCDCNSKEFFNFIQQKKVDIPELQEAHCGKSGALIFKMTFEEMCPPIITASIGIGIGIALLGILTGIAAALFYHFQQEIKVWLYAKRWCLWFVTEDELDKDKIYDAFISYSHKDVDFVRDLVARLEEGDEHFKLCVHYRDWLPGDSIPTQIAWSVENSRRTIVVLSRNFLASVWGKMEFGIAHHQALSDGRTRVIIILYGEIGPTDKLDSELKAYLNMNTYVKWGNPWFWEMLKYALPHPRGSIKKKRRQTAFETQSPTMVTANEKSELIKDYQAASTSSANTVRVSDSGENRNRDYSINEPLIEEGISR